MATGSATVDTAAVTTELQFRRGRKPAFTYLITQLTPKRGVSCFCFTTNDIFMHPYEEATIRAFIAPPQQRRWLALLASKNRRRSFLDHLNHCGDFDERYATPLRSMTNIADLLLSRGAGPICYVISDLSSIDGRELPLSEATLQADLGGFGTLICCLPGRLAYYQDEAGSQRRLLLDRG